MAKLSPNQRAKLEALWRSMPEHMRGSLLASAKAAAAVDCSAQDLVDTLSDLEESVREPAGDMAKAFMFSPLRALVAAPDTVPPSRVRFSPEQINKMWGWLGRRLAKDTIEKARKCKKPETDVIWHQFRAEISGALEEAVFSADRVPKDMTALMKRFGNEGRSMLFDAITLLRNSFVIEEAMGNFPKRIFDLDEGTCVRLSKSHSELIDSAPEAAIWVLLLVMGRLDSPWEIFRVIEMIGKRGDDLVVSKTELAAIGDAVLADTGYYASLLKQPPGDVDDAKLIYETFDRYVGYSSGMTKEFGIRKDGRWGRSLFGLRAEASTNVEKIFEKIKLALDSGLPEPRRGRSGRIIPAQLPPDAAISRLKGLLYFLAKAQEHAKAAAVASSQKKAMDEATSRMESAGGLLVDLVADSQGQNRVIAEEGLDITVGLMEIAGLNEAASLLRRRGNAAAAA